jgi:hypothetical protein
LFAELTAQSICTNYSCFENMGWFVPLKKKLGPKYGVQKAGCKKQGHCYSKREEARVIVIQKEKRPGCFFSF